MKTNNNNAELALQPLPANVPVKNEGNTIVDMLISHPLSTSFVNAFAAIGVAKADDEGQHKKLSECENGNATTPLKNQKKPSSYMTGTPSSTQRPSKIRQSIPTPPTIASHQACTQPVIASTEEFHLLPPPTISSQFNQDCASRQLFLPQSTNDLSLNIDLVAQEEKSFYKLITAEVKDRFHGFKFKIGIPVKNGAEPGLRINAILYVGC